MKTNKQGVRDLNGHLPLAKTEPASAPTTDDPSLRIASATSSAAECLASAVKRLALAAKVVAPLAEELGPHSVFGPILAAVRTAEKAAAVAQAKLGTVKL